MTPTLTQEEAQYLLYSSTKEIQEGAGWSDGQLAENLASIFTNFNFYDLAYQPSKILLERLGHYSEWTERYREARRLQNKPALNSMIAEAGVMLEEIVYLAFKCLDGFDSIKSYQSYASQYDLLVSGSSRAWAMIIQFLHLPETARTLLIEVKNTEDKVSEAQFSRLCSIMHLTKDITCALGIFVSRMGATGFPNASVRRQRALKDSRATQALFHAKTSKFVIVLDEQDIAQLAKKGSLLRILEAKNTRRRRSKRSSTIL